MLSSWQLSKEEVVYLSQLCLFWFLLWEPTVAGIVTALTDINWLVVCHHQIWMALNLWCGWFWTAVLIECSQSIHQTRIYHILCLWHPSIELLSTRFQMVATVKQYHYYLVKQGQNQDTGLPSGWCSGRCYIELAVHFWVDFFLGMSWSLDSPCNLRMLADGNSFVFGVVALLWCFDVYIVLEVFLFWFVGKVLQQVHLCFLHRCFHILNLPQKLTLFSKMWVQLWS